MGGFKSPVFGQNRRKMETGAVLVTLIPPKRSVEGAAKALTFLLGDLSVQRTKFATMVFANKVGDAESHVGSKLPTIYLLNDGTLLEQVTQGASFCACSSVC